MDWQYVNFCSNNGLAPNMCQANTWTSVYEGGWSFRVTGPQWVKHEWEAVDIKPCVLVLAWRCMHPMQGSVDDDCFWEREATGDNESALMHWGLDNMADIVQTTF